MKLVDVAKVQMELVHLISSRLEDCGIEVSDRTDIEAEVHDLYSKGFGCDATCLEKLVDAFELIDQAYETWKNGGLA